MIRENEAPSKLADSQVKSTRIIIAEPDSELLLLYGLWQRSIGFEGMKMTGSGKSCIDQLYEYEKEKNKDSTSSYRDVIVILDTHLRDIPSIQLAKEILTRNPNHHIIFTTTMPIEDIRRELSLAGLRNYSILTKPFELSKLSSLLLRSTERG